MFSVHFHVWMSEFIFFILSVSQVWDSTSDSMITFNHKDLSDSLAYIVENDIIQDAILKQLETIKDRVAIKYDCRVQKYNLPAIGSSGGSQWAQVHLSNGERLQSRLLVWLNLFIDIFLCQSIFTHRSLWCCCSDWG